MRLAFAVMVESDSDILLIDEVLAVGDAAFQQKCLDVFYDLRERGRTIVLVTHDMGTVERFCHRAMLLAEGSIAIDGEPDEVGRHYLALNFKAPEEDPETAAGAGTKPSAPVTVRDVWVEDDAGQRVGGRLVLPLAVVLTSAFNFGLNLLALFAFLLVYGITPTLGWLGIPLLVGMLVLLTSGVAMLLSALYVRFRDVGQIWGLTSQILFYGSLVFFTIERVHSIDLRRLVLLNPIAAILQQARHWIIDPGAPSLASAMGGGAWVLAPLGLGAAICILGLAVFNHEAPKIAERL